MEINHIRTLQQMVIRAGANADWSEYGAVKAIYMDHLVLFNYTEHAQFEGRWNWFERVSRGLILNWKTGEVVARPFDKFFNWGEQGRTSDQRIISVTAKMDGSLGILYRYAPGDYRIATRGSFNGAQALWATKWLNANVDVKAIPDDYTLLMEIIYPENRIVVNYGDRAELVLLAVRNRRTGAEVLLNSDWGKTKLSVAPFYPLNKAEDIVSRLADLPISEEGYVALFSDGQRFKFKGAAYLLAHKFISSVTFNNVLEAIERGTFADMIAGIPDEFLIEAREMQDTIIREFAAHSLACHNYFDDASTRTQKATGEAKELRKNFAAWIIMNVPTMYRPMMFAMLDDHDITPIIYKLIRTQHKEVVEVIEEIGESEDA